MRPKTLVVVTGTGTEIGKTWVAAELCQGLRTAGLRVAARKPAQSFGPEGGLTDAEVLAGATGEESHVVCPAHRWYPVPMAPPMAAEALGQAPARLVDLVGEVDGSWPPAGADVGVIEGAGGVASPLACDGDSADLARMVEAELVVLVADAGLGTINAVRLATTALTGLPVAVHLNRFDPDSDLHNRNRDWLTRVCRIGVTTDVSELVERVRSL